MVREEFAEKERVLREDHLRTGFTRVAKKVKNDDGTESRGHRMGEDVQPLARREILANFRNSYFPRIAVTVDMISTGTDVKPIECVFFLRKCEVRQGSSSR